MRERGRSEFIAQPATVQTLYTTIVERMGENVDSKRFITPAHDRVFTFQRKHSSVADMSYYLKLAMTEVSLIDGKKKYIILSTLSGHNQVVADKTNEHLNRLLNEDEVQAMIEEVKSLEEI